MTGENFKRINRNEPIKRLKDKIQLLKNKCGDMCNVNSINENGFDEDKYNAICKEIEWNEYLLWGLTAN